MEELRSSSLLVLKGGGFCPYNFSRWPREAGPDSPSFPRRRGKREREGHDNRSGNEYSLRRNKRGHDHPQSGMPRRRVANERDLRLEGMERGKASWFFFSLGLFSPVTPERATIHRLSRRTLEDASQTGFFFSPFCSCSRLQCDECGTSRIIIERARNGPSRLMNSPGKKGSLRTRNSSDAIFQSGETQIFNDEKRNYKERFSWKIIRLSSCVLYTFSGYFSVSTQTYF